MYAHMYPAWKVTLPMAITQLGPCLDQGWSPSPKWWSRGLGRLLEQLEKIRRQPAVFVDHTSIFSQEKNTSSSSVWVEGCRFCEWPNPLFQGSPRFHPAQTRDELNTCRKPHEPPIRMYVYMIYDICIYNVNPGFRININHGLVILVILGVASK